MKTGYKVRDAMTNKPVKVTPDMSIRECAKIMARHDVGSLLIVDDDILKGIVTEEDFVRKAIAGRVALDSPVADIMSTDLITVSPNDDIFDALTLMNKNNIRHLPVVDSDNRLVGYITANTILRIQPQLFEVIAEKIELRGINPESEVLEQLSSGGVCEACGNYSENLVEVDGVWLCPNCR